MNIWFVAHPHIEPTALGKRVCYWNISKTHRRKLMRSKDAHYLASDDLKQKNEGDIYFAGEWECCSFYEKNKFYSHKSFFKNIHEPIFTEMDSFHRIINTDPFVLGKKFYYVCCGKKKGMQPGDIVIFGRTKGGLINLVVDTIMVLEGKVNRFDNQQVFFPSGYYETTLSKMPLDEEIWVGQMYEDNKEMFSFVPCKNNSDFFCPIIQVSYNGYYLHGGSGANHLTIPNYIEFKKVYDKIVSDIGKTHDLGVYMPMPIYNPIHILKSPEDYDYRDYYEKNTHETVKLSEIIK